MNIVRLFIISLVFTVVITAQAQSQPNILLIIADDMGIDASTCYMLGNQQAPMPNLQTLCDSGVVFDNAYAAPVCSPTRATIMTGKYGFRTGVGAAISPTSTNYLSADETSLFDVLADTDYSANLIGKWHLAGAGTDLNHPNELGVPDYFGLFRGATRNYSNWTAVNNGQEERIQEYTTTVFTDRAIDWIDAQEGPWFLWLAHNAPHAPFHLPPAELHSFDDLVDDEDVISENPLPYYQAMLEALDTEIGRLLAAIPDDTIVMFIGDNGSPNQVTRGFFGEHDAKGTIYEGGTHIPFIVSGPNIEAGRSDALVQSVDIFATVASIAGVNSIETDVAIDSIDFSPVLFGEIGLRDKVYVEHFSDEEESRSDVYGWALRAEDIKLVWLDTGQKFELYNLASDPLEEKDLLLDGISTSEQIAIDTLKARYDSIISRQLN